METKQLRLQIKELADEGQFVGLAAVYNNRDFGGDIILPGAFTKSIQERSGRFPLFYQHRVNVGISTVEDSPEGLLTKGFLNLDKQAARDVYSDMKFYKSHGLDFGMSIGYKSLPDKSEFKGGARVLREVMLFENTLDELPLNDRARVHAVKGFEDADDILSAFSELKSGREIAPEMAERLRAFVVEIPTLLSGAGAGVKAATPARAVNADAEPESLHSLLSFLKEN